MPGTPDRIAELIIDHLNDDLDQNGADELEQWMALSPANRALVHEFTDEESLKEGVRDIFSKEIVWQRLTENVTVAVGHPTAPRLLFLRSWWAAASIILLLASGAYFWFSRDREHLIADNGIDKQLPADIEPGRDGAVLTLADGTQVVLDSLGNGIIANQNGTDVILQDGRLAYNPADGMAETMYNTVHTPKGRQFNILLSDGSRVWLNSASSLRYPTVFSGRERNVEITGEAYFEVADNEKQPFKVSVNKRAEVEVLGTSFNVYAYDDDTDIQTTLLEGSVKVALALPFGGQQRISSGDPLLVNEGQPAVQSRSGIVLKPGQQARIQNPSSTSTEVNGQHRVLPQIIVIDKVKIDKVMAWKNGLFNFDNASLRDLMNQLERWYDITVEFEKNVPDVQFGGEMSRNVPLSEVLDVLEGYGVRFRMEGAHKLTVLP